MVRRCDWTRLSDGYYNIEMNGIWAWANKTMTSCWKCPEGYMGQRERIKKSEFLKLKEVYENGR